PPCGSPRFCCLLSIPFCHFQSGFVLFQVIICTILLICFVLLTERVRLSVELLLQFKFQLFIFAFVNGGLKILHFPLAITDTPLKRPLPLLCFIGFPVFFAVVLLKRVILSVSGPERMAAVDSRKSCDTSVTRRRYEIRKAFISSCSGIEFPLPPAMIPRILPTVTDTCAQMRGNKDNIPVHFLHAFQRYFRCRLRYSSSYNHHCC